MHYKAANLQHAGVATGAIEVAFSQHCHDFGKDHWFLHNQADKNRKVKVQKKSIMNQEKFYRSQSEMVLTMIQA